MGKTCSENDIWTVSQGINSVNIRHISIFLYSLIISRNFIIHSKYIFMLRYCVLSSHFNVSIYFTC